MKKIASVIFLLVILSYGAFGQGYVQPPPDANGLVRLANTSVNYYTGTPGITIPLTELSGRELKIPVSLAYNASGFKVQDIAGSSGLGWNLNAGGMVTRIVRGMPDDLANGYCKASPTDTEPDLYIFNFLGRSGKFVLNSYGTPMLIPYQDLIVRPGICAYGSNGVWEIVDETGVTYRFGKNSWNRETTTTRLAGQSSNQWSYTSTWYLDEVVSPDGTDIITLSYLSTYITYKNYYYTKYETCYSDLNLKDETTTVTVTPRVISSITSARGYIYFGWAYGREDLNGGYYLSNITVSGPSGQVQKYRFAFSYFQSDGCSSELCKRLRLDKIYDLAPDPLYAFTYNTTVNLPSRDSKNFDHWGYYNNNTVNTWMPEIIYNQPPNPPQLVYAGASRVPDETKSQANLIQRIDYREGGSQDFLFEAHKGVNNELVGGTRIKRITVSDGQGNSYNRNFYYHTEANASLSSGILFYRPAYLLYYDHYTSEIKSEFQAGVMRSSKRFSSSYAQLLDVSGYHIGYSRVEERSEGKGKIVYTFSNFDLHPDTNLDNAPPYGSSTYKGWERGNLETMSIYNEQGGIVSKQINEYDYALPNKSVINGNKSIRIDFNCYGTGYSWRQVTYQVISRPIVLKKSTAETYEPGNAGKKMSEVTEYTYNTNTFALTKTARYDLNRPSIKYLAETKFANHSDYDFAESPGVDCNAIYQDCTVNCDWMPEPDRSWCLNDCYYQYTNCTDAPPAYASPEVAAIMQLRNRHQLSVPIETIATYQDGASTKVLSSSVNIYQLGGNTGAHVKLKETWAMQQAVDVGSFSPSHANTDGTFGFDNRLRKMHSYDAYDQATGNLLQETGGTGISQTYAWGHNNTLVTSVTKAGAVPRQVTYTHKPLVGETSVTDANGIAVKYDYDVYNRLSMVKDNQDNVLKRYSYHYKGETPGFSIYTNRTQVMVGENVSFSITDIAAARGGTPQFIFDFGDGTVQDNAPTYVNHTYGSSGSYTVKLVGMNPEYGAATRTVQMEVYDQPYAYICENGPVYTDVCNIDPPYYGPCTTPDHEYDWASVDLTLSITGGCPSSYTYYWEYSNNNNGYWYQLGTGSSVTFYTPGQGNYQIRCTITDGCYNTFYAYSYISRYNSSGCPEW